MTSNESSIHPNAAATNACRARRSASRHQAKTPSLPWLMSAGWLSANGLDRDSSGLETRPDSCREHIRSGCVTVDAYGVGLEVDRRTVDRDDAAVLHHADSACHDGVGGVD